MAKSHIEVIKMPSRTYLNLSDEKKQKLMNAAKKEFSRVLLSDASINKIIKEADISRGSFYMYFKDKEDLYTYLLKEHRMNGLKVLLESLHRSKGDIVLAYEELYSFFIERCFYEKEKNFFRNIFQNANLYLENKTGFCAFYDEEEEKLFLAIEEAVDLNKLSEVARENVKDVLVLLFDTTIKNIIPVILMGMEREKAFHQFQKSLKLIKGGICK